MKMKLIEKRKNKSKVISGDALMETDKSVRKAKKEKSLT